MKIILELDDATLHQAVANQVDKAIAELATKAIDQRIDEILAKKFDRVDEASVEKAVGHAAAAFIRGNGNKWDIENSVRNALSTAAKALIRDHARITP